ATAFPAPWKQALFACDWAYGRIHAVFLEPEGASYRGRSEVFASGEPFPVTDVVAGPDGALYVSIGGRKTQSGLYRIAWSGSAAEASEPIADEGAGAGARPRPSTARARPSARTCTARRRARSWTRPSRSSATAIASCATPRASRS